MAELDTSPAELVLGQMPRLPGDVLEDNGQRLTDLLQDLRNNAAKPPVQTGHHQKMTTFTPKEMETATHVYQKVGKPVPLGPLFEGPFRIVQRIGKSCLKIFVGNWVNGKPRHELTHWNNCFPAPLDVSADAQKAKRGRKLNANAVIFRPSSSGFVV